MQIWSDRVGLRRRQTVTESVRWMISSVVCRRLRMRVLVQFFSSTAVHCTGRRSKIQICKKSVGVHPVASSLAINEATHIEWLHKKGVVDGCRCRRPIAKALNRSHADFVQNRLSLNLRLFLLLSCGEAQLSRRRVSISQLCYSQHGTGPARH